MPELPDLEVFASNLQKHFKNKTLEKVEVTVAKKLNVTIEELKNSLSGQVLIAVTREGKTLQLHFKNKQVVGLHLMLHGELRLLGEGELKFSIVEFHFADAGGFALTDFQKQATPTLNPAVTTVPDAVSNQMSLTYLEELLSKKRTNIKTVLMDQHLIRGIGNTYADEILWAAKISPFSVAKAVPKAQVKILHHAIAEVLKEEIKAIQKVLPNQINGEVHDFLNVHHPDKEKSPGGAVIKIEKQGGRKSYFTDEQVLYR